MVKLNRIYTRTGDKGETGLAGGSRRFKYDPRIEAIGEVDEANAALGLARLHAKNKAAVILSRVQQDLFDLGADLATLYAAPGSKANPGPALRIVPKQITRLEKEMDTLNAKLKPLNSFVLPGGSAASAYLHLARTLVRRAERRAVALAAREQVNPDAIKYLNRLSDLLFVLARHENGKGKRDVLWVPGKNR